VAVISPLSKEVGKSFPNLVQTITSPNIIRAAIFDFMRSKNGNVIAVVDKKKVSVKKYIVDNQKDVRFAAVDPNGALNVGSLKSQLVKNKINYVVMETANTSMIKATLTALLSVQPFYNVQLVILEPNETLDTDEIEFESLIKLKLLYPSMSRENDSDGAMLFENTYKAENKILLPTMDQKDWFASWFNTSFYHDLYAKRNDEEAKAFMDSLSDFFKWDQNVKILDACCGSGRHALYLESKGFQVFGLDLSENNIMST
jgi:hypothetical protein